MPHAENEFAQDSTMGEPMTNGEKPHSVFLQHLTSYPLVSDSISTYKSNPYGQKSLSLAESIYGKFVAPVVPHLRGPYSYVAPYVAKADSLADSGLSKAESKFPIVKEDTEKIKGTVYGYASLPLKKAEEGKEYLFSTYSREYDAVGGQGAVKTVKALISTDLRIMMDVWGVVIGYLGPKKAAAQQKASEKMNN